MIMTPNPCVGCDKKVDCEFELMACQQFANFVTYGKFSVDTPKHPTFEIYNKIFDSEVEVNQIWERL
jgi:hypothetical protein